MLVVDVLVKKGEFDEIFGFYSFASSLLSENERDDEIDIAMFSSSLANFLYITESQNAYFAHFGLLELGKCNLLAKSGHSTYSKRGSETFEWVFSPKPMWPQLHECPSAICLKLYDDGQLPYRARN